MAFPLSLTIPASPGWASWLQGLGISLAFTTSDVNAHEVQLGQGGQVIAPYPGLTFPARAAINRCNKSMVRLLKRHLGAHQSNSPPDP